jgi:hypothetical protein
VDYHWTRNKATEICTPTLPGNVYFPTPTLPGFVYFATPTLPGFVYFPTTTLPGIIFWPTTTLSGFFFWPTTTLLGKKTFAVQGGSEDFYWNSPKIELTRILWTRLTELKIFISNIFRNFYIFVVYS